MEKIENISITNYRAIDKFSFKPSELNIFVGPNNSGKSSILESIAILLSGNNFGFIDKKKTNIWKFLINDKEYLKKNFVKSLDFGSTVNINLKGSANILNLEYSNTDYLNQEYHFFIMKQIDDKIDQILSKVDKLTPFLIQDSFHEKKIAELAKGKFPKTYQKTLDGNFLDYQKNILNYLMSKTISKEMPVLDEEIFRESVNRIRQLVKFIISDYPKIILSIAVEDKIQYIGIDLDFKKDQSFSSTVYHIIDQLYGDKPFIDIVVSNEISQNIPLITSFERQFKPNIRKLYDLCVDSNKIEFAIKSLKNRIPNLEDIRKTDEDIQIIFSGNKKSASLSSMGDGFKSLIRLFLINSLVEDGVVIFEEPEISLHPGYVYLLIKSLLENPQNNQYFVSTHSIDLLRALLDEGRRSNKLEQIRIIRMNKKFDSTIFYEILTGTEAQNEFEKIGTDLRGI